MGQPGSNEGVIRRLVLPALVLARSVSMLANVVTGFVLIEIGTTFSVPVGIASQIRTAASTLAVFSALVMGALSVRYTYKVLLLIGIVIYGSAAVGSSLAPSFLSLLVVYAFFGFGSAMVTPMVTALVGTLLPADKRTSAIGLTVAGMAFIYFVGIMLTNVFVTVGGWQLAFLGFVFPVAGLGFVLAWKAIPPIAPPTRSPRRHALFQGFKAVSVNRSAMLSLVGTVLAMSSMNFWAVFSTSFWRQHFLVSRDFMSWFNIANTPCFAVGSLLCGRLSHRMGRRLVTVLAVFVQGLLVYGVSNATEVWLSLSFGLLNSFIGGIMITALTSYNLEQVPQYHGTMMSLSFMATNMGGIVGGALGGIMLLLFNYRVLGMTLGTLGIVASLIFQYCTRDPTKRARELS